METRWVYRGVAGAIRLGLYADGLYHSALSRSLRYAYQDILDQARITEVNLLVSAIITANSNGSHASTLNSRWRRFLESWPHIRSELSASGSRSADEAENSGRALMEKFIKYREQKKSV